MSKKEEIIDIAKIFFYTQGYNKTSIQNIIDKADIAKGTFYHYFKSKEDLLNQYVELEVSGLYQIVNNISDSELTAVEKFEQLFRKSSNWKTENIANMRSLLKVMMSKDNLYLRDSILKYQLEQITPIYTKIINQGKDEGLFNVIDSQYTAALIINIFSGFTNKIFSYLSAPKYTLEIFDKFIALIKNYEDTLTRVLGLKNGTIELVSVEELEKLVKGLMEA